MENNEILETAGQGGGLNYAAIILMQVNRLMEKGSQSLGSDPVAEDAFKNAVIMLDILMEPYHDKDFDDEKDRIKSMDPPVDEVTTLKEFRLLARALTSLMSRCGLMPFESGALYDEDDTDVSLK